MSHLTSQIDDVLSGRVLSAEDDARFRAHLRQCAACRKHYDETAGLLRLARGHEDALAPGEQGRLEARAIRLARPVPGTATFPWRFVFAGAALAAAVVLTVAALPRSPVGRVLAASAGLRLDGVAASRDAVVLARAEISTEKEDAAILLEGPRGRRGLLLSRHREHIPRTLPSDVRHVEYAPFSELLPRCAALVHHGGIGTSAQALAAGVPQLIMPMGHDQPDNSRACSRRIGEQG